MRLVVGDVIAALVVGALDFRAVRSRSRTTDVAADAARVTTLHHDRNDHHRRHDEGDDDRD